DLGLAVHAGLGHGRLQARVHHEGLRALDRREVVNDDYVVGVVRRPADAVARCAVLAPDLPVLDELGVPAVVVLHVVLADGLGHLPTSSLASAPPAGPLGPLLSSTRP